MRRLTDAGASVRFDGKVFGEFTLRLPKDPALVQKALLEQGILAGLPLGPYFPKLADCLLVAVTETRTKAQIDDYASKLSQVLS